MQSLKGCSKVLLFRAEESHFREWFGMIFMEQAPFVLLFVAYVKMLTQGAYSPS